MIGGKHAIVRSPPRRSCRSLSFSGLRSSPYGRDRWGSVSAWALDCLVGSSRSTALARSVSTSRTVVRSLHAKDISAGASVLVFPREHALGPYWPGQMADRRGRSGREITIRCYGTGRHSRAVGATTPGRLCPAAERSTCRRRGGAPAERAPHRAIRLRLPGRR